MSDYDELLQHVFLGDITRFAISLFKDGGKSEVLMRLLGILDRAMGSEDEQLQELISVSFLENLYQSGEYYGSFKKLLGKSLSEELMKYENIS